MGVVEERAVLAVEDDGEGVDDGVDGQALELLREDFLGADVGRGEVEAGDERGEEVVGCGGEGGGGGDGGGVGGGELGGGGEGYGEFERACAGAGEDDAEGLEPGPGGGGDAVCVRADDVGWPLVRVGEVQRVDLLNHAHAVLHECDCGAPREPLDQRFDCVLGLVASRGDDEVLNLLLLLQPDLRLCVRKQVLKCHVANLHVESPAGDGQPVLLHGDQPAAGFKRFGDRRLVGDERDGPAGVDTPEGMRNEVAHVA